MHRGANQTGPPSTFVGDVEENHGWRAAGVAQLGHLPDLAHGPPLHLGGGKKAELLLRSLRRLRQRRRRGYRRLLHL